MKRISPELDHALRTMPGLADMAERNPQFLPPNVRSEMYNVLHPEGNTPEYTSGVNSEREAFKE